MAGSDLREHLTAGGDGLRLERLDVRVGEDLARHDAFDEAFHRHGGDESQRACGVDGRDVRRPGSAGRLGSTGLAGLDPLRCCIDAGEEPAGETAAIEVAREAAAAGTRLFPHHLGQARDCLGAPWRPSDTEPGKQLERVGDQDSPRGRRRIRDELVTVERAADRSPRDHAVLGEILLRQAPTLRPNVLADAAAELATVERGRALVGEELERGRKIGHHEPVAGDEPHTFGAVDLASGLGAPEDHVEDRVQEGLRLRELVPIACNGDRGLEQAPPRQGRVIAVRGFEAGDRPGNTAGGSTDPEDLRRAPVELDVDGLHLPGRAGETLAGNGDEEVVQSNSARRRFADKQAAAMHASTAFPPSRSTSAPASAVSVCPAATAPLILQA